MPLQPDLQNSLSQLPPQGTPSGDPDQEYFVDGTTDELITHLAQKCMVLRSS